jgi:hypothetical protein
MNRTASSYSVLLAFATISTSATAGEDFPPPRNTERAAGGPVSAAEAAAGFLVPPGFLVTVFAAEPDVQNPIAMA